YAHHNLRGVMIFFWQDPPDKKLFQELSLLNQLSDLLLITMDGAYELKDFDDYSQRLSELIDMFELNINEFNYNELLVKLMAYVRKIIPQAGICVFTHDVQADLFNMVDYFNDLPPHTGFISSLTKILKEFCCKDNKCQESIGKWEDISDKFKGDYTAVLVSPVCFDLTSKTILVTWTNEIDGFTVNDRELLSVFGLFTYNILKNAATVKKLSQTNRLLKKSSQRLANVESLAALADMTSGVAHDLNNIIGGVIGRIQLLKLKVKNEPWVKELNKIEHLVLDGADTIKRVQEFSVSAKNKKLDKIDLAITVNDYFKRSDLKWQKVSEEKNISVTVKNFVDNAFINGISDDIFTILDKLIENAVENAYENSSVDIIISDENKYYQISVSNQGQPIDNLMREKIFYPFYSSKKSHSAGLGLSIVHGIVVRHQGKIDFESDAHRGTMFKVKLPKVERLDEVSEITRKDKRVRQLKILLVDDDEQIREVLSDMLTIDGHEITACSDGHSALSAFRKNHYDLIITDLGMPGMSGLDLSGIIHKENPQLPIAMITGWGTQLNKDEIAMKGVKALLPKPFHLKDIKALIKELVVNQ
ncbi:MAG: hybrid sensor histidine kinase/response regulator, partial [FCB group bacterium]|nr:hybrid sensor histidine kinase/response regulator [FCB group bacterium]